MTLIASISPSNQLLVKQKNLPFPWYAYSDYFSLLTFDFNRCILNDGLLCFLKLDVKFHVEKNFTFFNSRLLHLEPRTFIYIK